MCFLLVRVEFAMAVGVGMAFQEWNRMNFSNRFAYIEGGELFHNIIFQKEWPNCKPSSSALSSSPVVENNVIYGQDSTVGGDLNTITGSDNTAIGCANEIYGNDNTALGSVNTVDGSGNVMVGDNNNVEGHLNTLLGSVNCVDGDLNGVIGNYNNIEGSYNNVVEGYVNTVFGDLNTIDDGNFNVIGGTKTPSTIEITTAFRKHQLCRRIRQLDRRQPQHQCWRW